MDHLKAHPLCCRLMAREQMPLPPWMLIFILFERFTKIMNWSPSNVLITDWDDFLYKPCQPSRCEFNIAHVFSRLLGWHSSWQFKRIHQNIRMGSLILSIAFGLSWFTSLILHESFYLYTSWRSVLHPNWFFNRLQHVTCTAEISILSLFVGDVSFLRFHLIWRIFFFLVVRSHYSKRDPSIFLIIKINCKIYIKL